VLFLACILVIPVFSEAQVRQRDSTVGRTYRALVDAYRAGDVDGSMSGVLALDQKPLQGLVRQYAAAAKRGLDTDPALDAEFFRAAAMLHTDAAFRCWDEQRDMECGAGLELARLLVDVSEQPKEGAGSFRRRWYAASALVATGYLVPHDALDYFKDAIEILPDDVPLLTAAGWYSEWLADQPAVVGSILSHQRTRRQRHHRDAVEFLTAALRADPRAQEAALRLARVEALLGDVARASERLTALLAQDDLAEQTGYVARLILGDIRERQGDTRAAERLYREAMTFDPVAQSARIALGHLLYVAGDASGAAHVVEPFVTMGTPRQRNDPWSDYRVAFRAVGVALLEELRKEVQR
jgi:tetratricopeptide (TPR) repeat protein